MGAWHLQLLICSACWPIGADHAERTGLFAHQPLYESYDLVLSEADAVRPLRDNQPGNACD